MSFYRDFIDWAELEYQTVKQLTERASKDSRVADALHRAADKFAGGNLDKLFESVKYFEEFARKMRMAKIIKVSGDQCKVFLDMPAVPNQDARWLRLPFPFIWLQLDVTFKFKSVVDHKAIAG